MLVIGNYHFFQSFLFEWATTKNFEYFPLLNLVLSFCLRIFVNRSLHLENIKFYGFDMDYTLAGEFIKRKILLDNTE